MTRDITIAACLALSLLVPVDAAMAETNAPTSCIADWSDAATVVLKENLLPANNVHALVKQRHDGDLVRIVLCRDGKRFVYRIHLRRPAGQIVTQVLDARTALQVGTKSTAHSSIPAR